MLGCRFYEELAIKVLAKCHDTQPELTYDLLERQKENQFSKSCLKIASKARNYDFLSHTACQNSVNISWKKGIRSTTLELVLCLIFPPLICLLLDFKEEKINCLRKTKTFYTAPFTKFAFNMVCVHVHVCVHACAWVVPNVLNLIAFPFTM